ncbi:MAG: hypothetical protein L0170_08840, partial [Acidobacteria bacterium]|nr:hypothetical protein [Acidobacteriota bacterium]
GKREKGALMRKRIKVTQEHIDKAAEAMRSTTAPYASRICPIARAMSEHGYYPVATVRSLSYCSLESGETLSAKTPSRAVAFIARFDGAVYRGALDGVRPFSFYADFS